MEPEPNRDSTVDGSGLVTNDLQIADMDETSNVGSHGGEGQNAETPTVSMPSPNYMLLQHGNCRICFAGAAASGEDPILELGCHCRDDLRFGHQSCLTEWFVRRVLSNGTADCEVCRGPLAAHVETRVMSSIQEALSEPQTQGVPRIFLLLQVPEEELDRLQVSLDTPDFYELPPEARSALSASFRIQEEAHRLGEFRRTATFMMAHNLGERPLRPQELQARVQRVAQLRDQVIGFEENTHEERDTIDHDMDIDSDAIREVLHGRRVIRVDVNQDFPTGQQLWSLLDDLSLNINLLGANTSGEMWFIPSSMYNFDLTLAHYNPSRISAEGVTHRQYTYGRFGCFVLHNMPGFM